MRSLGRRTDLMFTRFAGEVHDRGDYVVVRTPSNPTFHWGNYLILRSLPRAGDYARWMELFDREFPPGERSSEHLLFALDSVDGEVGDASEFLAAGMSLERALVLTTKEVVPPPRVNQEIAVRTIKTLSEWDEVIAQQVLARSSEFEEQPYRVFKERQFECYKKMSEAGLGAWYGAFIGDKLVADLGIFHEEGVARFQAVNTRPSHQRRGICGTLVYQAASMLLEQTEIDVLVMEADAEYHAARIYESVGFARSEENHAFYRYPRSSD